MSDDPLDTAVGSAPDALALRLRAAGARARAEAEAQVALADYLLPREGRLDDRTRTALDALLRRLTEGVAAEIREYAARQLVARHYSAIAEALVVPAGSPVERLAQAGLLRDPALTGELIARVREDALGAGLRAQAPESPGQASLINRSIQNPDRVLASSALAVTIAEGRRRSGADSGRFAQAELPAALHRRLVWAVAAVLRERCRIAEDSLPRLDRALAEAAQRSLAAYDEGDRLESAAMRFAAALDAPPEGLGVLLVESLGDQRIAVFTALLAHALATPYEAARALVLDPRDDRLALALRSLDLGRERIAQIGYALCEADMRRDLERFADTLDIVMTLAPPEARDAIEPIRLDPDYCTALAALRCSDSRG